MSDGDSPTKRPSQADAMPAPSEAPKRQLPGWPIRPRPGAANVPTMVAPNPRPEPAARAISPQPGEGYGAARAAPAVPERELRGMVEELANKIGHGRDADASAEIPPPEQVPAQRAAGATDPYIGTTFDHRYKIEQLLGE